MTRSFAQLRGNGLTDWRLGSKNKSRPDDVSFIWPQPTMSLAANRRADCESRPMLSSGLTCPAFFALPYGVSAEIDCDARTFSIVESAVV